MSRRAHYFQHVPFEGLGSMEPWLAARDYEITVTRQFAGDPTPAIEELADIDLLVVMGGPMSVNDTSEFAWLNAELAFVSAAINADTPTLGICLGAQLIAKSLGSTIGRNPVAEIGWFDVETIAATGKEIPNLPERYSAFHWHGETFDTPAGAHRFGASEACDNQAFIYNERVIGLQFHLETTPESARLLVEHCGDELESTSAFVQSADVILGETNAAFVALNKHMETVLSFLLNERS